METDMSAADNTAPATYTYDQLSVMWQVSVRHLQREVARGRLCAFKIGGRTRFTYGEVERYIAAATREAVAPSKKDFA
jgi:excisionase family DNA binding protein